MFFGIDGGGTKTKAMLTDENLNVLAESVSGPSSIRTVPIEESIANITSCLNDCLEEKPDADIKSVFAGLGDVAGAEDGRMVASHLCKIPALKDATITVKNDVYNAHAGALDGESGIAIIIGTGSVAFGVDEKGMSHRAGGYSYKEGDYSSAYGLGKQALSLIGKAMDNRAPSTPLTDELIEKLNIRSFPDAVKVYDTYHTKRTEVAKLAKIVTKHAANGDTNALGIIDYATDELALMIKAIDRTLNLKNKAIGIIGSLGNADTPLKKSFIKKIKAYNASYRIFKAKKDPVHGSCVLARQALNTKQ